VEEEEKEENLAPEQISEEVREGARGLKRRVAC
jgi:hypothetical protein